jgi:hypothetical protein
MASPHTEKIAVEQPYEKSLETDIHSESSKHDDAPLTSEQAGDAALANAPWQYKLIALVTALLFPSKTRYQ